MDKTGGNNMNKWSFEKICNLLLALHDDDLFAIVRILTGGNGK